MSVTIFITIVKIIIFVSFRLVAEGLNELCGLNVNNSNLSTLGFT